MAAEDPTADSAGAALAQSASALRTSGRKRKPVSYSDADPDEAAAVLLATDAGREFYALGEDDVSPAKKRKKDKGKAAATEEKRLRRFRDKAPKSYAVIKERALTQRMFVIDRTRAGTDECPEEHVDIAGTTGNIYTVTISKIPSCTCPHAEKGNQCKHIVFVLIRVLKAPEHLQYQLALVPSELRDISSKAPSIPSEDSADGEAKDGKRKPIEGDCPICCEEFERQKEKIVYCRAACGNNIHKTCFEQWAATKHGSEGVTCPYCRAAWLGDEDMIKRIAKAGKPNAEGYVNVANELGISGQRVDYSSYNPFWVRQEASRGHIDSPY